MKEATRPSLSVRVDLPNGGRLGPGKAALLGAIASLGSLNKAAAELGMSYPRARKLVEELNRDFERPLVSSIQGGGKSGGSQLTREGRQILALYRELCEAAESQNVGILRQITQCARKDLD